MHVLLVDDELLAREELNYLVSQHPAVSSVAQAESIMEAMTKMMEHKPDILFLDIHLTDESGFELAEKLVTLSEPPYLVFATAYDDYALQAFQVNASDYLLKPFEEKRVMEIINKARKQIIRNQEVVAQNQNTEQWSTFPIHSDDRIFLIHPETVQMVSVDERNISIFTDEKCYVTTGTLSGIEQKLPPALFIKTHRSFIINVTKVKEIQPWFNHTLQVTMENGEKVPVSRSYLKAFKSRLNLE